MFSKQMNKSGTMILKSLQHLPIVLHHLPPGCLGLRTIYPIFAHFHPLILHFILPIDLLTIWSQVVHTHNVHPSCHITPELSMYLTLVGQLQLDFARINITSNSLFEIWCSGKNTVKSGMKSILVRHGGVHGLGLGFGMWPT